MTTDNCDLQQFLTEVDSKKVETLRKAISNGTYVVPAEDLAPKIMQHMLRNSMVDETSRTASASDREPKDQMKTAS